MDLDINGTTRSTGADPDEPAVDVLRDRLGLTGTKLVCGTGVCGACTVLVDGTPQVSCLTPCGALQGRKVTTVEGLGGEHPVQRAFAALDGLQCGYCTPGFVVEAAAFVDRWRAEHGNVAPDRAEIASAMAGHLCRCGAYEGIYAAIAAACAGEFDAPESAARIVENGGRIEAMDKVTGRARFTTDVRLDGQLEGAIVRSSRAHARVVAIESDEATLVDLLPEDRTVRFVGQPIAAVAAPTRAAARALAARLRVRYEPLPAVTDMEAAEAPGAPPVYPDAAARKQAPNSSEGMLTPAPWDGNVRGPGRRGLRSATAARRIAAARARGDERLVSACFTTQVQVHTALEPHACVARWDGDDLTLYISTQAVENIRREAKEKWNPARVEVIAEHVGGGFGAKQGLAAGAVAAVELARAHGAPVRVVYDREEEITEGGNRPGTRTELSMLADDDGNLAALTMDTYGDGGVSVGSMVALMGLLMYGRSPRRVRDFDVVTNCPPGKPFRGPGAPPALWALEQAVDEMAHRLGEDPIALRRRWDGNRKRQALYDWVEQLPVWRERRPSGSQTGRFRRGVGVAAGNWLYFLDPSTEVELTVEDGVVVARTSTQDIGTGIRSVIGQIVRAELGLPADRVRVEIGRTTSRHGPASAGSRTTASVAPATMDAARRLRAALASGNGSTGSVLEALDGAHGVRAVGRRRRDRGGYLTPFELSGLKAGRGFSGAVHVTEVEVDTRLGTVRPLRVWGGLAVGRIYAERLARAQCAGGIIQGVGYALYEERKVDPATGAIVTGNLEDYRIPGIGDTPEIDIYFHTDGWDHVTGGGIGIGEICTVGVAASIGNAVYNATGWRPLDLPIRPDRVRAGLAQATGDAESHRIRPAGKVTTS